MCAGDATEYRAMENACASTAEDATFTANCTASTARGDGRQARGRGRLCQRAGIADIAYATLASAPTVLSTNDKAVWVID